MARVAELTSGHAHIKTLHTYSAWKQKPADATLLCTLPAIPPHPSSRCSQWELKQRWHHLRKLRARGRKPTSGTLHTADGSVKSKTETRAIPDSEKLCQRQKIAEVESRNAARFKLAKPTNPTSAPQQRLPQSAGLQTAVVSPQHTCRCTPPSPSLERCPLRRRRLRGAHSRNEGVDVCGEARRIHEALLQRRRDPGSSVCGAEQSPEEHAAVHIFAPSVGIRKKARLNITAILVCQMQHHGPARGQISGIHGIRLTHAIRH